jgi:hypothetical protein
MTIGENNMADDEMAKRKKFLTHNPKFLMLLGAFFGAWASFDMTVDMAIGKLLGLPHEITHLLTVGLDFNRKVRVVEGLAKMKDHKNRAKMIGALRRAQNHAKRNIFAHCVMQSTETSVSFLERTRQGELDIIDHTFTLEEFAKHVHEFTRAGNEFYESLEISISEYEAFVASARAEKRASTSAAPPEDKV